MRIAYIVSAYKYPAQLARLLERLQDGQASFAVHVDRKTTAYSEMVERTAQIPEVRFLPRHVSHWGGFGHVRATLKGISDIVERGVPFDYAVLLTAQDYPLRSPRGIARFLAEAGGRSFMNHWTLPFAPWGERGGLERVEDWHVITYRRLHAALPLKRTIPGGLPPVGGGAYWCLARPIVEYVHDFVERNPDYVRFFKHVLIPDELFFQTIVINSPLRETVTNENLRYIDWSREPAPAVLRAEDFPKLVTSGKLFARKFDMTVDVKILDLLDDYMDQQSW
jgi:Core-2/I-Branching enzyme